MISTDETISTDKTRMRLRGSICLWRGLCIATCVMLGGCASIEPWVKPYERDNLADTIMSMNRNPVAIAYSHHVYQAREGARGAEGGAGGGCGCN